MWGGVGTRASYPSTSYAGPPPQPHGWRGTHCPSSSDESRAAYVLPQLHVLCFGGGGAVVAYSAEVSQPLPSLSAPLILSMVFTAHSSNDSAPLPFESSLAKALRRGSRSSFASILPSLFLSARLNRRPSRLWALASGATSAGWALSMDAPNVRACGADGKPGPSSARDCQTRNAPVMRRKQAAAPAKKRSIQISFKRGDSALRHAPKRSRSCQPPGIFPKTT